jgi:3-dehydroquinate dehydratase
MYHQMIHHSKRILLSGCRVKFLNMTRWWLHRHSKVSAAATAVICGLGPYGYFAAMGGADSAEVIIRTSHS